MKRKSILFVYLSLLLFGLYPLEYKEPLCLNVSQYANSANMEVDLEKYRLFIANGDISFLSYPYLSDLLLGTLSKEELRIFRNMFYAAKGYSFDDKLLTEYFSRFHWYNPKTKDISFSEAEKKCINKIKEFEKEGNFTLANPDKDLILNEFNGGADQRGCIIKLNKNYTFIYTPAETINRIQNISGKWEISKGMLVLEVENMLIVFGGYISEHPTTPFIKDGYLVSQKFEKKYILGCLSILQILFMKMVRNG